MIQDPKHLPDEDDEYCSEDFNYEALDEENSKNEKPNYSCPLTGAPFKYVPGDPFW